MWINGRRLADLLRTVFPNPTTDLIDEGAALAHKEKVEAVVGLGGGSATV